MKILIVYKATGHGVARDGQILKSTLENISSEVEVDFLTIDNSRERTDRWFYQRRKVFSRFFCWLALGYYYFRSKLAERKCDLAIYIESARPSYMFYGRKNILIPNLEWLSINLQPMLVFFDGIWCKTQEAKCQLEGLGLTKKVSYISFSSSIKSEFRQLGKDYSYILHRAGNSAYRGTAQLVELWKKHPEWPELRILMSFQRRFPISANNICYIDAPESDVDYQRLIATSGIQIFPSQVEGYGLTIAEALGYGNVVVTTNAPPMNELVQPGRGVLLSAEFYKPLNFASRYHLKMVQADFELDAVLSQARSELEIYREQAMTWFDSNHSEFEVYLADALATIQIQ